MISLGCQFWDSERDVTGMMAVAVVSAGISSYAGLLLSYHANLPSGPAIILAAGLIYVLSIVPPA
jgi:zinc/manganese transport system permease protein